MTKDKLIEQAFMTLRSAMPQITYTSADVAQQFGETLAEMHASYISVMVNKLEKYIDKQETDKQETDKQDGEALFEDYVRMLKQSYDDRGLRYDEPHSFSMLSSAIIKAHNVGKIQSNRMLYNAISIGALVQTASRKYMLNANYQKVENLF